MRTRRSNRKDQRRSRSLSYFLTGVEGIVIMMACYLTFFLKPLRDRWGFKESEVNLPLPGDALVPHPRTHFTHAIRIKAPIKFVWPWVAQMGRGKGGFYSYESLENLVGLDIHNTNRILPQFQNPKEGDLIGFGPKDAFPLVIYQKECAMVIENYYDLEAGNNFDPGSGFPSRYLHLSWLWYVHPLDPENTLFISRNRLDYKVSGLARLPFGPLSEPIVFTMDRKMCFGIKKRAEEMYSEQCQ